MTGDKHSKNTYNYCQVIISTYLFYVERRPRTMVLQSPLDLAGLRHRREMRFSHITAHMVVLAFRLHWVYLEIPRAKASSLVLFANKKDYVKI